MNMQMNILEEFKHLQWNFRDWKILPSMLSSSRNTDCMSSPAITTTAKNISGSCKHIRTLFSQRADSLQGKDKMFEF